MFGCYRTAIVLLLSGATWLCASGRIVADDLSKTPPGAANANARATSPGVAPLPDDIKELLAFVKDIHAYDPNDPDERVDFEQQRKQNRSYVQVEASLEKIRRIATPADKDLPGFADAMALRLVFRTAILPPGPRAGTANEREELIDEVGLMLASASAPPRDAIAAAKKIGGYFERTDPKRAMELYRKYGGILANCTDAKAAAAGARMEGAARRLELVGKPLELSGTLVDGTKFDWARHRGKIVLVDVWATWCGPCLRELPQIEKCYRRYHDQGFDVVAISVDEDRAALDKFLSEKPQPWANLHDGTFQSNPFANRYGLRGIPTMILVDRDGKVISIDARPPGLEKLLAEQFAADAN